MFRRFLFASIVLTLGSTIAYGQTDKDQKKDEPKQEEKKEAKKEPAKPAFPGFPDIDDFLKKLPDSLPKEQVDQIRKNLEQAKKRMEEAQKRIEELKTRPLPNIPNRFGTRDNRLGARLEKPNDTLVAQLGLATGKGQVLADVKDGSAAGKAGLKTHDILLELNGKDVSSNAAEFAKALNEIKKDTPVDAVVLRAGKRETIKGITLPDVPKSGLTLPLTPRIEPKRTPAK